MELTCPAGSMEGRAARKEPEKSDGAPSDKLLVGDVPYTKQSRRRQYILHTEAEGLPRCSRMPHFPALTGLATITRSLPDHPLCGKAAIPPGGGTTKGACVRSISLSRASPVVVETGRACK